MKQAKALWDEYTRLNELVQELGAADWHSPTPFKQWTPWDVIAHLHLADSWAVTSLRSRQEFDVLKNNVMDVLAQGKSLQQHTRDYFRGVEPHALQQRWGACMRDLCETLCATDPDKRLPWFGPDMRAKTFASARFMETWAHGQDIHDYLGRHRTYTDRIYSIAELGVKTYAFTFRNRGLEPPAPIPYVRLTAPSGKLWEWHERSSSHRIEGKASEFCHVVTQGRNVMDTQLHVAGQSARHWMTIAQCFAGKPEDPPEAGTRVS